MADDDGCILPDEGDQFRSRQHGDDLRYAQLTKSSASRPTAGWGIYENDGRRELAFWIGNPFDQQAASVVNGSMVAFSGASWKAVDEFHAAALANGGPSEGAPGLRPHYGKDFYAAYVRDLDGNKVAAVCRGFTQ